MSAVFLEGMNMFWNETEVVVVQIVNILNATEMFT